MNTLTFQIPNGCKVVTVEQIGNQIITTFEPIKKERWRAEKGNLYHCPVWTNPHRHAVVDHNTFYDNFMFENGLYCQTYEQAQRLLNMIKQTTNKFWEEELR